MKRIILSILMLAATLPALAWQQRAPASLDSCKIHAPYGFPQTTKQVTPICRQGYLSAYDPQAKIPLYVMYELLPQNALGCVARTNAFVADQSVPGGPTPQDYVGSNYDKGHLSPDGDQSWDVQVEFESFLMTNMSPQAGSLNRGAWKLLETSVRGWSVQLNNSFTVIAGDIYGAGDKTIGKGVVVPHALYKIVIDNQTGQIAGWRFPHVAPYPNLGNDLTKLRMPISQIEQEAGVRFAFPPNAKELAPGQEWPVNFGTLTQAKRAKCGANSSVD